MSDKAILEVAESGLIVTVRIDPDGYDGPVFVGDAAEALQVHAVLLEALSIAALEIAKFSGSK